MKDGILICRYFTFVIRVDIIYSSLFCIIFFLSSLSKKMSCTPPEDKMLLMFLLVQKSPLVQLGLFAERLI